MLVDAWLTQVLDTADIWLGRGQCIGHYGVGEVYLPLLEALGAMCRSPGGHHLVDTLEQQVLS